MQENARVAVKKLAFQRKFSCIKKNRYCQFGLMDFNQPIELKMNPENRRVKKADLIQP